MKRKLLIVASLLASTTYIFACGSSNKPAATPPSAESEMTSVSADPAAMGSDMTAAAGSETAAPEVHSAAPTPPPPPKKLYDRIGKEGFDGSIDDFMKLLDEDKTMKKKFASVLKDKKKKDAFKLDLHDHLCSVTGGSCDDKAKDLAKLMKDSKIKFKADEFASFEDMLMKAFEKHDPKAEDKDDMKKAFDTLKSEFDVK